MVAGPTLLVVDDEEVICQGCRRVLSRQGYQVEVSKEAREGLNLANERDYDAILLDISMPTMNGIEFLEQLRQRKPDVPVIFITGYPSIPNATSAIRLGAADYITKPFTPEEITECVQRLVRGKTPAAVETPATINEAAQWITRTAGLKFWDETWMLPDGEGDLLVGPMLGRSVAAAVRSVRLPHMGEIVYQGLPMAGLIMADGSVRTVPAPVSGVVSAINASLADHPAALADATSRGGWIAAISPTRLQEEERDCRQRQVLLLNANEASAREQSRSLTALGCQVRGIADWSDRLGGEIEDTLLILDSSSLDRRGPEIVERINALTPAAKIVVLAAPDSRWESHYRRHKIFFYAIQPFVDGEIVDILDAAFRNAGYAPGKPDKREDASEGVSKICITNRNGKRVCLLAESGLLQKDMGLGRQLRRRLLDRAFPVETTLGSSTITPLKVMKAVGAYDRLIVLLARDNGSLPGTMIQQHPGDLAGVAGEAVSKATTFIIQPDKLKANLKLDDRTTAMLAEHLVRYLSSL